MAANNRSKAAKAVLAGDVTTLTSALVAGTAKAGRAAHAESLSKAAGAIHISATDDLRVKAFKQAILPLLNRFHGDADVRARVLGLVLDAAGVPGDGRSAVVVCKALAGFADNLMPVVRGVGPVSDSGKVREVKGKMAVHIKRAAILDLMSAWAKADRVMFHGTSMTSRFLTAMVAVTGADAVAVADAAVAVAA